MSLDYHKLIVGLLLVIIGVGIYFIVAKKENKKCQNKINLIKNRSARYERRDPNGTITVVEEPVDDMVDNYLDRGGATTDSIESLMRGDYRRAVDPLIEPSRRPSLDSIPPPYFADMINIRTRPYYDTPSVMGVLSPYEMGVLSPYEKDFKKNDKMNGELLQLYGAKDDVNTYKYNYYAVNRDGVKLEVNVDRNTLELNTNDVVMILDKPYTVTLYPDKFYKYNPYAY